MCNVFQKLLFLTGFNRYMVECESSTAMLSEFVNFVLIDTWWNVNLKRGYITQQELEVLIDTWWNVNVEVSGIVLSVSLF